MSKVLVSNFSISLDGYGAGPAQALDNPLGIGGLALHDWMLPTRTFRRMQGHDDGETGIDDDFVARGLANIGAWILGRNMFAPLRGPWTNESWTGWWGDNPPYHTPVFVLTKHPRPVRDDEGRYDLPLRNRRHSRRSSASDGCSKRARCSGRWRCRHDSAVSRSATDR
jgi:dihydrofolate reductase